MNEVKVVIRSEGLKNARQIVQTGRSDRQFKQVDQIDSLDRQIRQIIKWIDLGELLVLSTVQMDREINRWIDEQKDEKMNFTTHKFKRIFCIHKPVQILFLKISNIQNKLDLDLL